MVSTTPKLNFATLNSFARSIAGNDTIEDVCNAALPEVVGLLGHQAGVILLLDKHGLLTPRAYFGLDQWGRPIPVELFPAESYQPGQGFLGKTVLPTTQAGHGSAAWTPKITEAWLSEEAYSTYCDLLGDLQGMAAIPLQGRRQSYGVLVLLNKLDPYGAPAKPYWSTAELDTASAFAGVIGDALALARARTDTNIIAGITEVLARIDGQDSASSDESTYQEALKLIVGRETPFDAAVLRLLDRHGNLKLVATASDSSVSWSGWRPVDMHLADPWLAARVCATNEAKIIPDARNQPQYFNNIAWIEANHLRTAACFPLKGNEGAIGTLTVYCAFVHSFPPRARKVLAHITQSLFARAAGSANRKKYRDYQDSAARRNSELEAQHRLDAVWSDQVHFLRRLGDRLLTARNDLEARHMLDDIIGATVAEIGERIDTINDTLAHDNPLCPTNLAELVATVVHYHRLGLRGRITISSSVETNKTPMMEKGCLHAVLDNLLNNAIEATKEALRHGIRNQGTIKLTVRETSVDGCTYVDIAVQDNGIGISPELQEKLCKPGVTTHGTGRGYGLYTVKNVALRYAGDFFIASPPGVGTTVTFRLSLRMFPQRKESEMMSPTLSSENTVVVMDDEPAAQAALGAELVKHGFMHKAAATVEAAKLAAREGADKFVIDIRMDKDDPDDRSGLAAINEIRTIKPNATIIVYSAFATPYANVVQLLGADDVLTKKWHPDSCVLRLEKHVLRRQLEDNEDTKRKRGTALYQLLYPWNLIMLIAGALLSGSAWLFGVHIAYLSQVGTILAPLAAAILVVLLFVDRQGMDDPSLNTWTPFLMLHRFKVGLIATILGGFVYDVLKIYFIVGR